MKLQALLLLTITPTYLCLNATSILEEINRNVIFFNKKSAALIWLSSINPGNPKIPEIAARHQNQLIKWREHDCELLATLYEGNLMNSNQTRQACLMCRRPIYDLNETRIISELHNELQKIYTEAKICIPSSENIEIDNIQVQTAILNYLTKIKDHDVDSKMAGDFVFDAKIANENKETGFCLKGEKEFEEVMENSDDEAVLRWIWMVWREKVGPPMREPYRRLVDVENVAVRRHEYKDLGESWRDELETPYLRQICHKLYNDIKPLYTVLHGVVRFYLRRLYGEVVPKKGPIPAHLLGNLWSKNWAPIFDKKLINLNQSIKKLNWTALDMARKADDFYRSLGLPAMTDTFWRKSVIVGKNDTRCPAAITVANMFKRGDYRLFYCSGTTIEDFYVFHHVMGHIQYYMAYENQTALFQNAHPALHESIGDSIMYGVMTPQHLHRLGLVNDSFLYVFDNNDALNAKNDKTKAENGNPDAERLNDKLKSNSESNDDKNVKKRDEINKEGYITYIYSPEPLYNITKTNRDGSRRTKVATRKLLNNKSLSNYSKVENDNTNNSEKEKDIFDDFFTSDEILMFKQLLNKLPQIPFLLLMDEYRWKYFEGGMDVWEENMEFWKMATELQGITPPSDRGEGFFDVGAKFYVPYNSPSISYFLSSFLQHQLFESLCKAAVFGRRRTDDKLPDSIPLHRCDIYGSKAAGKVLKDLMSRGHSQHWREILEQVTGDKDISAVSLLQYYLPIYEKLSELVEKFDIPIGWEEETNS